MSERQFYSYLYLRKNHTPYYAGKGYGNRVFDSFNHRIKPPRDVNGRIDKSRILIFPMINEAEALESEVALIALFGRKDNGTGILRNLTDGGDGASGHTPSIEHRRKMSEAAKNRPMVASFSGKNHSEEARRKIADALRNRVVSEETRRKLSEIHGANLRQWADARRGTHLSEETRRKIGDANRNPSDESRRKMSEASKQRTASQETRRKLSECKRAWWAAKLKDAEVTNTL